MIKDYKHLNSKSIKKIMFYEKLRSILKKCFKWWIIIFCILLLFAIGIVSFYITLDKTQTTSNENYASTLNSKSQALAEDTSNLSELDKKELQRESEKEKKISDSNKPGDYEFKSEFYDFKTWNETCDVQLMVVNIKNPIPSDFKAETKNCRGKEVNSVMAEDLEKMITDAKKEGICLWISSGYRNIELQTKLFKRQVEREMSKEVMTQEEAEKRAAKVVAKPYTSEHNTGLAVDFNGVENSFYKTKEYKWLMDNACKYGFIERYQEKWKNETGVIYEPWHFRYVGKDYAEKIKESGLCLEGYVKTKILKD